MKVLKELSYIILLKLIFKVFESWLKLNLYTKINLNSFGLGKNILFIGKVQRYFILNTLKMVYLKNTRKENYQKYYISSYNFIYFGIILCFGISFIIDLIFLIFKFNFDNLIGICLISLESIMEISTELLLLENYFKLDLKIISIVEPLSSIFNIFYLVFFQDMLSPVLKIVISSFLTIGVRFIIYYFFNKKNLHFKPLKLNNIIYFDQYHFDILKDCFWLTFLNFCITEIDNLFFFLFFFDSNFNGEYQFLISIIGIITVNIYLTIENVFYNYFGKLDLKSSHNINTIQSIFTITIKIIIMEFIFGNYILDIRIINKLFGKNYSTNNFYLSLKYSIIYLMVLLANGILNSFILSFLKKENLNKIKYIKFTNAVIYLCLLYFLKPTESFHVIWINIFSKILLLWSNIILIKLYIKFDLKVSISLNFTFICTISSIILYNLYNFNLIIKISSGTIIGLIMLYNIYKSYNINIK